MDGLNDEAAGGPAPSAQQHRHDHDGAPPSVAHEAALLVDLLSARGWGSSTGAGSTSAGTSSAGTSSAEDASVHECTCGGRVPQACRLCPVCQLISFVQQISPEAIDRIADVVDLAATALRDLATSRRGPDESTPDADPGPAAGTDGSP